MADDGGIGRLTRRLDAIPSAARREMVKEALKQADIMADFMKRAVPVDTGDLKESITVTPPNQRTPPFSQPGGALHVPALTVAITAGGEEVRYAHLVEHGTVKTPAHPFFFPAFRLYEKKAGAAIRRAAARAAKLALGGNT